MRTYAAILALALLPLHYSVAADPAPADATPAAITLAQVLPTVQPPTTGVALVVGADKDTLPDSSVQPSSGLPLAECADGFGMITRTFGAVEAVAPASMVVLNNYPGDPDLSDVLSPSDAFKQLAASLNDTQWAKLTSAGGIGLSDLDDDQQPLFWAMFPGRSLKIVPVAAGLSTSKEQATDLSSDLPQAHIRVTQTIDMVGNASGAFVFSFTQQPTPGAPLKWTIMDDPKPPAKSLYGNLVRAVVDNKLKPSDLKYDTPALQAPIPLDGVKTVDDLVLRIGHATGFELYADSHYAARTVTFLGPDKTATASDLLQALALCVAGAYRAVGTAYVLTYDLTGLATTRETWDVYQEKVSRLLKKASDQTQGALYQRRVGSKITGFGDPLALSSEESAPKADDPETQFFPWSAGLVATQLPAAQLTSGQQTAAKQMLATYASGHAAEIAKNPNLAQDSSWKWTMIPQAQAQVLTAGFPQPIAMDNINAFGLLMPPPDVLNQQFKEADAWAKQHPEKLKPGAKPVPPLAELLKKTSHRAVLAAPRSPDEVKSVVASMQKLGLNELWLTVFADSQARIPSTPFPQPLDQTDDLLAAALSDTKGTGITVFPVANLLTWSQSPKREARDVNVLGENSVVIAARAKQDNPYQFRPSGITDTPPIGMWVSPLAPAVADKLTALVKSLASRPGIGGLIWRETAAPGYAEAPLYEPLETFVGYTEPARLGFLRAHHTDPLDISTGAFDGADFKIPNWDDSNLDSKLYADWRKYRLGAGNWLLRGLYQTTALATPPGTMPVVFAQQGGIADFQGDFEGGPVPSGPLPSDGSLPIAKPDITISTILLDPAYAPVGLAATLNRTLANKSPGGVTLDTSPPGGFALDIIAADGGMGAAGFADFAGKAGKASVAE